MTARNEAILFLGSGGSATAHSTALAAIAPTLPRYYASRSGTRARALCHRHRGAGWFDSYAEALGAAPGSITVITTPPPTHFELTFLALAADRHVIVDPPPCTRAGDIELVRDAARAAGRAVMVAANTFYSPLTGQLRSMVAARTLGEIRLVQVNALGSFTGRRPSRPGSHSAELLSTEALHWISLMSGLGMPVARASAQPTGAGWKERRSQVVTIEYGNGAVGLLIQSVEIAAGFRRFRLSAIHGTEGTALFETSGLFVLEGGRRRRLVLSARDDVRGRRAMFTDFLDSLRHGREPRYTLSDASRDLRLLEAVREVSDGSIA